MEPGREKSINDIIQRGEQERNRLLQLIELLITHELPETKQQLKSVSEYSRNLARKLNINFHYNEENNNTIDLYINKLSNIKQRLEELEINDETIINEDSFIKEVQKVTELIEPSLEKVKNNFYTLNTSNLLKAYEQKEKIKSEITDLQMKKMYLQGKLDTTRRKKEKTDIEQEIESLDDEIKLLENKLLESEFQEEISISKNDAEVQVGQENTKTPKNQEIQEKLQI